MARLDTKCPGCGDTVQARTEAELIAAVRRHGREQHGLDLGAARVKAMIAEQRTAG